MMLNHPPLIRTNQTPEDIIGPHNMEALRQHVKGYEDRAARAGYKPNLAIGELITRLQSHGYYIDGIDKHGDVVFRVVLKSELQQEFEAGMAELEGIDSATLRDMARSGYRGMRSAAEFGKLKN